MIAGNWRAEFQFLIGRLQTCNPNFHSVNLSEFQFLIGRLQTFSHDSPHPEKNRVSIPHRQATNQEYKYVELRASGCFNSSQVGYKLFCVGYMFGISHVFQFLIGRLQTKERLIYTDTDSMFQFLIGRLQTNRLEKSTCINCGVSIPHRQATNNQ